MRTRLGLDLGTNSIGWALFRLGADGEPVALEDGGALIHSDGRQDAGGGRGRGASNAAHRREKRGMRRNRDRMLRRRRRVAHLLRSRGLLPERGSDEQRKLNRKDPLELRAKALDYQLDPHELGRVLLSFAGHRGFKSNRRTAGDEDGPVHKDIKALQHRMNAKQARTLGEYLWRLRRDGGATRARRDPARSRRDEDPYGGLYPDRAMAKRELDEIRTAQGYRQRALAPEDWDKIIEAILFQRPLKPVEAGWCTFVEGERRAYRAHPLFQEFRIRQDVGNVRVVGLDGERPLTRDERDRLVRKLVAVGKMPFGSVIKHLNLPEEAHINLGRGGREEMKGDETAALLRKKGHFGKDWDGIPPERQREVVERLLDNKIEDAEVTRWLQDNFALSAETAAAVTRAKPPRGTGHLSIAALERLLRHMRAGKTYPEARTEEFPASGATGDGGASRLPYYGKVLGRHVMPGRKRDDSDVEVYGRIANPSAHIALGQLRRLFNAIAEKHGKPDEVVVELGRDLKRGSEERATLQRAQNRNEKINRELRECAEAVGHDPSGEDLEKLRLWHQQEAGAGRICPYTGKTLSVRDVLSSATAVDHILPYSRSFDDSRNNRVVVVARENSAKGNQTPYEMWGGTSKYEPILARVREMKRFPPGKRWRFTEEATKQIENGGFLERHLNETRYLSRLVRGYLAVAVPSVRVTSGQLTALLRRKWGLNTLLPGGVSDRKDRNDHRHHMIDAAVIGVISQSMVQRAARENARPPDSLDTRVAFSPPYPDFRADIEERVDDLAGRCVVRHRPDHFSIRAKDERRRGGRDFTTGSLHNETAYGIVEGPDERGMMTLVETKPLDALDPDKIGEAEFSRSVKSVVRDANLRERLKGLWERAEAEGGKPAEMKRRFLELARRELGGVRRVRVLTRLGEDSLAFIKDAHGRVYKAYQTDGNAYMDVWLLPDGRTTGETVSRYHANRLDKDGRPTFRSKVKDEHPTAKKLMRLHIDDMLATGEGDDRRILRVQKLSGQTITAVDHNEGGNLHERVSSKDPEVRYVPLRVTASRVLAIGLRKIAVDELGRVRDGRPFGPDGRRGGGGGG